MAKPILLYTPIYSEVAEAFTEKVFEHSEDELIEVWVNGPGGSLSAGWSMLAALNEKGFNTTVTGDASSFYFYMLLFSQHNTAFDTSSFLIHRAASMWEDMMSEEELKAVSDRNKIIRKKLEARVNEEKFVEVTGKTFNDIFSMEGQLDVRLNSTQMKKIGLIDKVVKLDVKKKEEIEAQYFNDIAALANPKETNSNINIKKEDMGIFSKDPLYIGAIDKNQFAYSKLEVNAKIKALGDGEKEPITGTFEANDKKVTVVADIITGIENIDTKQEQINALSSKITALTAMIEETVKKETTEEQKTDNSEEQITALTDKVTALTKVLDDAKLLKSNPDLPEGKFDEPAVVEVKKTDYEIRQEIEARAAEKQAQRDEQIKNGGTL